MCSKELHLLFRLLTIISVLVICIDSNEKVTETYVNGKSEDGIKIPNKVSGAGMSLIFVEELKLLIERQVLGICPQSYKFPFPIISYSGYQWRELFGALLYCYSASAKNFLLIQQGNKVKNNVTTTCDLEMDPQELAGRFAALALRAHSAARSNECSRLGISLANVFGELARTASNRHTMANSTADSKKRKLSKSQKAKIQAKQRTALAVKKKAAAIAARVSS